MEKKITTFEEDISKESPERQKALRELKTTLDQAQEEGLKHGFDAYKHYAELFRLEEEEQAKQKK